MGRWHVHRADGNEARIIAVLRERGATVVKLGQPVDLLIGYSGLTAIAEVKTIRGNLRESQRKFLESFQGLAVVLRTPADAHALLDRIDAGAPHRRDAERDREPRGAARAARGGH